MLMVVGHVIIAAEMELSQELSERRPAGEGGPGIVASCALYCTRQRIRLILVRAYPCSVTYPCLPRVPLGTFDVHLEHVNVRMSWLVAQ